MGRLRLVIDVVRHFVLRSSPGPGVMDGYAKEVLVGGDFASTPNFVELLVLLVKADL